MGNVDNNYEWRPPFNKWYNVDVSVYKFYFEQIEKRNDDVLLESEYITKRAILIGTGILALFSFVVGVAIKKEVEFNFEELSAATVIVALFLFNIIDAVALLFPKNIVGRGLVPRESIPEGLDDEENKGYQEQYMYYSALSQMDNIVRRTRDRNNRRAARYQRVLIVAIASLIADACFLASII